MARNVARGSRRPRGGQFRNCAGSSRLRRVQGLHHVAVRCADLGACERFYREVLGLAVLRRWPGAGGADRSVWLAVGDGFLALEREEPAAPGPGPAAAAPPEAWRGGPPGLHLVALRIDASERPTWEARLAARGVPVAHRTRFTLYVRDPEGNRIGLSHWPVECPDLRPAGSPAGARGAP